MQAQDERTGAGSGYLTKAVPVSPMQIGNVHVFVPAGDGDDLVYGMVSHPKRVSSQPYSGGGWPLGSGPAGVLLQQARSHTHEPPC